MLPKISVIIPSYNEEDFIENCVLSLITDSYPLDSLEVLIVDGGSTDDTVTKVKSLQEQYAVVRLLRNPNKTVPAAMNIGIAEAEHPIIVWCGSHAIYGDGYLKNSVDALLSDPKCSSAGGVITPIAKSPTGKAIAIATCNKFGIGNALYRYAKERAYVDTVFGGCFRKSSVQLIGGFNESWTRNQDYEFNFRLRKSIGPIILEPSIRCKYFCRETITALAQQYFEYGFWRFKTLLEHPASLTIRQLAPISLIIGLIGSLLIIILGSSIGWILPLVYFITTLIVSARITIKQESPFLMTKLPIIFPTLHLSWGLGFIVSAVKNGFKLRSKH